MARYCKHTVSFKLTVYCKLTIFADVQMLQVYEAGDGRRDGCNVIVRQVHST